MNTLETKVEVIDSVIGKREGTDVLELKTSE